MKTYPLFSHATLAITLLAAGSAAASDSPWQTVDNHHGAYFYLARPVQMEPTVAFGGHPKSTRSTAATVPRTGSSPRLAVSRHEVITPHGTVSYFAPAN